MELSVRFIGAFQLLLYCLLWPYYTFLSFIKRTYLPPMKSPLLQISGVELARKIRNKEVKCREVVVAYIERIRDVNPILNALVEERFNGALEDADKVDAFLATTKLDAATIESQTPLLGVPITVKESIGLKGGSHCVGSVPRVGVRASEDGGVVGLMKRAGSIPLCLTTTPEYCMSWETESLVNGVTNNPYDPFRTCGGSSGGEGALLGAGASVIGLGSDIAGSIRIPSLFNGIYGHKPTPGYVTLEGHFPNSPDANFNNFLAIGPMCRYVDDLKPTLKIMAGDRAAELRLDEEVDLSELNVFWKEDAGFSLVAVPVSKEIKRGVRNSADFLERAFNCRKIKADIEEFQDSVEISTSVFLGMEGIPNILETSSKKGEKELNLHLEVLKSYCCCSEFSLAGLLFSLIVKHNLFIPKEKYETYCQINEQLRKKIMNMLGTNGVLLYPTAPLPALYHRQTFVRTASIMYTMIFNTLRLPSTHVPLGLDKNGLPIGLQVVASENQDRLCLAVAKALNSGFGGWVPPPSQNS